MYLRSGSHGLLGSMVMVDRTVDGQHWTAWIGYHAKAALSHPATKTGVQARPTALCWVMDRRRCRLWTGQQNGLDVPGQKPFDLKANVERLAAPTRRERSPRRTCHNALPRTAGPVRGRTDLHLKDPYGTR